MSKPVIALCGAQQNGKSTAAAFLESQGFVRVSFAEPLYQMLSIVLGKDARSVPKEEPQEELLGQSVRYALQRLGTEWGRNLIGDSIWAETARRRIQELLKTDVAGVVIDDFRYANEFAMLSDIGARVFCVARDSSFLTINEDDHASEKEWKELVIDGKVKIIRNNGSLEDFHNAIREFI